MICIVDNILFLLKNRHDLVIFNKNCQHYANLSENPIEKGYQTLTDQIFYKIQSAIICGELAAGSKISEPELARVYGISRGPLREAIHRLEGQKLVERTAHVGARVVSLSHQQLHELYQIRENLEGLACRLAAQHIDKKQIITLRDILKRHAEDDAFKAGKGYFAGR